VTEFPPVWLYTTLVGKETKGTEFEITQTRRT
jgi:hypothetical protein